MRQSEESRALARGNLGICDPVVILLALAYWATPPSAAQIRLQLTSPLIPEFGSEALNLTVQRIRREMTAGCPWVELGKLAPEHGLEP